MLLLSSADFFKINFFQKLFSECFQNVKQLGSRVQTVCKGYQQMTKVATIKERINMSPVKQKISMQNCEYFIINQIAQKEHFIEMVLLITHYMFWTRFEN